MKKYSKIFGFSLVLTLIVSIMCALLTTFSSAEGRSVADLVQKELKLWYDEPAPDDDNRETTYNNTKYSGWEVWALPIGNGFAGSKVFGLTERERIQINENTLSTNGNTKNSGTTNFTETYVHFNHTYENVTNYSRDLILGDATSHVKYDYAGVTYTREYFASYPDGVIVLKFDATGENNLDFTLEPKIPYYNYEHRYGYTYDGEEHEILYTGEIPEGAHVTYSSNKATNAGTYTATVTVSHKNYNTYTANAVLTVKKATITGVSLESATFTYDGEEKSLSFIGTLPEGVTPVWSGNAATEVGNHPVALRISGENYEALELSAFIIIEAAPIVPDKVIEGVSLENGNFVYDGTEKSIEVTGDVPAGVSVSYAGNGKVNAGEYSVTAVLTGDGYETLTLTAKIIIAKAKITGVTLEDASFTYDANAQHSIKIVGTIPDGTSIEYTGNKQTNAGTYKVTAVITGENYETLILEATMTIVNSSGGGIVTPPMPF